MFYFSNPPQDRSLQNPDKPLQLLPADGRSGFYSAAGHIAFVGAGEDEDVGADVHPRWKDRFFPYQGKTRTEHPTVEHVWADGGYSGELVEWAARHNLRLEIVRRGNQSGFQVLPRRWVVERTFGWLGFFRRLSKEYEELLAIAKSVLYSAMTQTLLRRLTTE